MIRNLNPQPPPVVSLAQATKGICVPLVFLSLLCLPGSAKAASGPSEESAGASGASVHLPVPQIHADAEPITIDMVVRDKKNRPVTSLTPKDLAVSDGGTPVQLSDLHLVTAQAGAKASIAFLFDRLSPQSAKAAREIAGKLVGLAPAHVSFAVLGLDDRLRLLQNYTGDRTAIDVAIGLALQQMPQLEVPEAEKQLLSIEQSGKLSTGVNASVEDRAKARIMVAALEESVRIIQDQHASAALAGMLALAKAQQSMPGRKVLVFFSEGLPANASTESMTRDVVEAAGRAGLGIYAVDASGVKTKAFDVITMMNPEVPSAPPNMKSPMGMLPGINVDMLRVAAVAGGHSRSDNPFENDHDSAKGDPLALLAIGTGGFSIRASEDVRKPLLRLVEDVSDYYEASYVSNLKEFDGQFHPISIQPLQKGVTIRSRAGYFALPPEATSSLGVRPFEAPLLKILSDSQKPSEVEFQQAVLHLGGKGAQTENELVVEVPVSHLDVHTDQHTLLYSAHVSILAQVKDKSGVVVEHFSEDIARNGALEAVDGFRAGAVTLQRHFTAAPGEYLLEAVVLDRQGQKTGAARSAFTVPAPDDGPWLSDVALVRENLPYSGAPDPLEPLRYGKSKVVPNLAGVVAAGTNRVSFFFSIQPDTRLAASTGKLDMEVWKDGKSISHSSMNIVPSASGSAILNEPTIQASSLAAGFYRAVFTYTQGEKSSSRELGFTVLGNGAVSPETNAEPDAGATIADLGDLAPGRFSAAANTSAEPSEEEKSALIGGARKRALGYLDSLVNFKCIELTDRFADRKGTGNWTKHDKIAELLTYESGEESRTILDDSGKAGKDQAVDMKGARLTGEFGGVLEIVFDPKAKTEFTWKETDTLDGAKVEVFRYAVDAKNSKFMVTALPHSSEIVGFNGLVYIDAATRGVRRVVVDADGIPSDSAVSASGLTIDYDYITINNHDYLMPVRGELRMKLVSAGSILHRIEFRDYHRFGSEVRIVAVKP